MGSNSISAYCYLSTSMCVCDADLKNKIYDIVNSIVVDFASTISGDTEKAIMSFRCAESTDFGDLVRVFVSCRRLFAVGVVKAHVV